MFGGRRRLRSGGFTAGCRASPAKTRLAMSEKTSGIAQDPQALGLESSPLTVWSQLGF